MISDLPLSGLKIIDLTNIIMGPYTTQLLGDLGADVIKVEDVNGDMTRNIGIQKSPDMASMYLGVNRNKRSITLDLKKNISKKVLWKLIKNSDVFIHNMRPQKITRLGFTPMKIKKKNNKMIFVGLYGYGKSGVYTGQPVFDDIIQGQSGLASLYQLGKKDPLFVPSVIADKTIGLLASTALLAAYIKVLKKGEGSCVEISMFEGMVSYVLLEHQYGQIFFPNRGKTGYPRLLSKNRRPYKTKNGYICILPYTDKQWLNFFEIVKKKKFINDKRFSDIKARSKDINLLYKLIKESVREKTNEQLCKVLKKNDIPHGVVNTLENLQKDKHLKKVNFFRKIVHPSEGSLVLPDTGIKINSKSLPIRKHQPSLGENSKEILEEIGYNSAEIKKILKLNKK